jgi:hypothetical protein
MLNKSVIEGCIKNDRKSQKILFETLYGHVYKVCILNTSCDDTAKEMLQLS